MASSYRPQSFAQISNGPCRADDILWNFQKMTMQFTVEGQRFELKGIHTNKTTMCALTISDEVLETHARKGNAHMYSLQLTEHVREAMYTSKVVTGERGTTDNHRWQHLIHEFLEVFEVPKNLPPERELDHKIKLKEGTVALSQKP
ncbi:hypothetical protein E3N88_20530 [Mikania micrantha]|uniref:Uncharacterized protein n=1 Tax=Mikania micrantha TaxID=192012 RepID=A0A5N6NJQ8_9ASTR|nr:hypothetical protein E3N88_20530 [Mikania micrantha]